MYNAIFRMCHHMLRNIHQLVSFQTFLTLRRAMWSKENILGCLSNRNKGTVSYCCIQNLAVGDICWKTTVMPHWQVC